MTKERLKQLRQELGLTTTKAAVRVGCSTRTWQRMEQGKRPIPDGLENKLRGEGA